MKSEVLTRRLLGALTLIALAFGISLLLPWGDNGNKSKDDVAHLDLASGEIRHDAAPADESSESSFAANLPVLPPPPPGNGFTDESQFSGPEGAASAQVEGAQQTSDSSPEQTGGSAAADVHYPAALPAAEPPPAAPTKKPEPVAEKPVEKPPVKTPEPSAERKPEPKSEAKPQLKPAPRPEPPKPAPVKPTPPAPAPSNGETWYVQAGSFSAVDNAHDVEGQLARIGIKAIISPIEINGRVLYRVRGGPYSSRSAADSAAQKIKAQGLPASIVPG